MRTERVVKETVGSLARLIPPLRVTSGAFETRRLSLRRHSAAEREKEREIACSLHRRGANGCSKNARRTRVVAAIAEIAILIPRSDLRDTYPKP